MSTEFEVGDKVHYAPRHDGAENGVIKSIGMHTAFVVYKCGGDLVNYADYTGSRTDLDDLRPGWIPNKEPDLDIINDDYF